MSDNSNKISKFWNELKRRSVLRSLAIYAGSAFVFLEAATIIFPRWGFPDWTIDLVLYLLILGAFITVIVAWIFDITPDGVQRTKPTHEIPDGERSMDSKAWKAATYISLLVIVVLIIFNVVPFNKKVKPGSIQSILVLPFDNYTGTDEFEYYVAGMHSGLIGDLGKISALRVISKTSSRLFKDVDMSIPEIASEVGVDAVIEPSISCVGGDSVCLQIKLISAFPKEKQLWVQDFRVEKSQILNFYNDVTKKISEEINIVLTPQEERLLAKSRTVDKEAYDSYLMGLYLLEDADLESLNKAREYLNSAVEKNPDWAPLYSSLAQIWIAIAGMGYESPEIAGPKIFENLNKALELDPNNVYSLFTIGMTAFMTEWDWEKAEMELLKALAANPNDAMSRVIYAQLLACLQRPGESLTQGRLAIELDPLNLMVEVCYSAVLLFAEDWETALAYGEKVTAVDPGHFMANSSIEVAAFRCRDYNKVMEAAKYIFAAKEEKVNFKEVERIFGETGFIAAYEEILRQLEVLAQKGYFLAPVEMAYRYMMVNQPDKAMEWIEKGFEVRDPVMPYIATHGFLCEPLFDNPRFIEIIQKMNLPLPEE
jgi:TolB-like protein